RQARLLGALRLPQRRRPVAGRTLRLLTPRGRGEGITRSRGEPVGCPCRYEGHPTSPPLGKRRLPGAVFVFLLVEVQQVIAGPAGREGGDELLKQSGRRR